MIEKDVTRIDNNGEEITKTLSYRPYLKEIIKLNIQTVIHVVLRAQTLKMN